MAVNRILLKQAVGRMVSAAWGSVTVLSKPGFRVLMYHAIGTPVPGDRYGLYKIEPARFLAQMKSMLDRSANSLAPFSDVASCATGIAVTFDDGYRDNFSVAYPMLCELGIPFTIFVVSDFIRSGDPIYLRPEELRELAADPLVTIGAHGKSHRRLTDLDAREVQAELGESRAYLEDLIGRPVETMSYPHGAVNERVRQAVVEAGYKLAACSQFGSNLADRDLLELKRTDIWSVDDLNDFKGKLAGGWDWVALAKRVRAG